MRRGALWQARRVPCLQAGVYLFSKVRKLKRHVYENWLQLNALCDVVEVVPYSSGYPKELLCLPDQPRQIHGDHNLQMPAPSAHPKLHENQNSRGEGREGGGCSY